MFDWDIHGRHFHIREARGEDEFHAIEDIQRLAWQFSELDVVPFAHLIASQCAGGTVLCSFEGKTMTGFVYGFPAYEQGRPSIHSHMLAVRPEYRNLQTGYYLKLAQRKRVLENGIDEISWTFDPLQSLNAHLNFEKLGVISDRYIVNFYGEASSSPLHQGFGTDRLWVSWRLNSDRVRQRLAKQNQFSELDISPLQLDYPNQASLPVLVHQEGNEPRLADSGFSSTVQRCLIEIPHDISSLKIGDPVLAQRWREATRRAFTVALASGFVVEELVRLEDNPPRWFYLLVRDSHT